MNSSQRIRSSLRQWILENRPSSPGDVLVDELCFLEKRNRADLVHANGHLAAFEIKASSDNLSRWPNQMSAYLRVFEEVWLCVHVKHLQGALKSVGKSVGLLVADDLGGVVMMRPAKENKQIDPFHLSGLLWRIEVDELMRSLGMPVRRSELVKQARERLANDAPLHLIQAKVLSVLKARYPANQIPYSSSSSS